MLRRVSGSALIAVAGRMTTLLERLGVGAAAGGAGLVGAGLVAAGRQLGAAGAGVAAIAAKLGWLGAEWAAAGAGVGGGGTGAFPARPAGKALLRAITVFDRLATNRLSSCTWAVRCSFALPKRLTSSCKLSSVGVDLVGGREPSSVGESGRPVNGRLDPATVRGRLRPDVASRASSKWKSAVDGAGAGGVKLVPGVAGALKPVGAGVAVLVLAISVAKVEGGVVPSLAC